MVKWDHCFYLEYTINLFNGNDEKLSLELKVINKNENKSFSFTGALHNYFRFFYLIHNYDYYFLEF